jgi:hypothetical protein
MNLTLPRRKHRRRTGKDPYAGQPMHPAAMIDEALARASGPQPTLTFDLPEPEPQPAFTPAPVTVTGPQQALRYVPGFYIQDADGTLPFAEEAAAATGFTPVAPRCDLCGAVYQGDGEGEAGEPVHVDRVYLALWRAAARAGWRKRWSDRKTCCPACVAAATSLLELHGGLEEDVKLMISLRVASGAYEDLAAADRRADRREERRRRAANAWWSMHSSRAAS